MNGSRFPLHSMEHVILELLAQPPAGSPEGVEVCLRSGPPDADSPRGRAASLCEEDVAVLGEGPKIELRDRVAIAVGRCHRSMMVGPGADATAV
jgi:hypothetical protein